MSFFRYRLVIRWARHQRPGSTEHDPTLPLQLDEVGAYLTAGHVVEAGVQLGIYGPQQLLYGATASTKELQYLPLPVEAVVDELSYLGSRPMDLGAMTRTNHPDIVGQQPAQRLDIEAHVALIWAHGDCSLPQDGVAGEQQP